jgi:3-oxoacyl-[acyl-carrier protein] reductase
MTDFLKGRVAIVTGSGQGVGRAIAIGLAAEGAKIVTNNRKKGSTGSQMLTAEQFKKLDKKKKERYDREIAALNGDAETTAATIKQAGGEAVPFFGDIADFKTAEALVKTAIDRYGKIDILVNIAGGFGFSPFEKMPEELFDRVTRTKPKGYFNTMRHAVPYMIEQKWGRIINCTSRAWQGDVIKHAEYCAANAGVIGLTKAVAIEMWEHNITANCLSPWAKTRAAYDLDAYPSTVAKEDMPFVGKLDIGGGGDMMSMTPTPDFIAPFICYLASEAAARISGSIFQVGGNTISLYSEAVLAHNLTKFDNKPWTTEELLKQVPRSLLTGYRTPAANPFG